LYIEAGTDADAAVLETNLTKAVNEDLQAAYPGILLVKLTDKLWTVEIPAQYKVGHEAHFTQVTEKYLQYLIDGKLPDWEVPNMIVKYYTTTEGLKEAMK
jgi:hypothetical protein